MEYILKRTENFLMVFKQEENKDTYNSYWVIEIAGELESVEFAEIHKGKIFVCDWNAKVRVYDIEKKELLFKHNYKGHITTHAKISKQKNAFVIAYQDVENRNTFFQSLDLDTLSTIVSHELPSDFMKEKFDFGTGDDILFYYVDEDWDTEEWSHGYKVLNYKTGKFTEHKMDFPQRQDFEIHRPYINPKKGIGVMPLWEELQISYDKEGKPTIPFKVKFFDILSFKTVAIHKVLDFPISGLEYNEGDAEEMIEELPEMDKEEYNEAMSDFYENLNSVIFEDETDSMWFCFRGGLLINMDYEGNCSSVLRPSSLPNMFESDFYPYFHSYLVSISKKGAIINEHDEFLQMDFSRDEIKQGDIHIKKPVDRIKEDSRLQISEAHKEEMGNSNKIVIHVDDIEEEQSLLKALDNILELCKDIETAKKDSSLIFRIKDKAGNYLHEKDFFAQVLPLKDAPKKISQLINEFVDQEGSEYLYHDSETTALAFAIYELAMYNEKYLPIAEKYFNNVDLEHDVFNQSTLIPSILDKYPDSQITKRLEQSLKEYYGEEEEDEDDDE